MTEQKWYDHPRVEEMMDNIASLEKENKNLVFEISTYKHKAAIDNEDICQALGKVLGYPWYKDDPKNFSGATEESGVCVGEHVAVTIAAEAAKKIEIQREMILDRDKYIEELVECDEKMHKEYEWLEDRLEGLQEVIEERDRKIESLERDA